MHFPVDSSFPGWKANGKQIIPLGGNRGPPGNTFSLVVCTFHFTVDHECHIVTLLHDVVFLAWKLSELHVRPFRSLRFHLKTCSSSFVWPTQLIRTLLGQQIGQPNHCHRGTSKAEPEKRSATKSIGLRVDISGVEKSAVRARPASGGPRRRRPGRSPIRRRGGCCQRKRRPARDPRFEALRFEFARAGSRRARFELVNIETSILCPIYEGERAL